MSITGLSIAYIKGLDINILQINYNALPSALELWQYFNSNNVECPYAIVSQALNMVNLGLNVTNGDYVINEKNHITSRTNWTLDSAPTTNAYARYYYKDSTNTERSLEFFSGYAVTVSNYYSRNGYPYIILGHNTSNNEYRVGRAYFVNTSFQMGGIIKLSAYYDTSHVSNVIQMDNNYTVDITDNFVPDTPAPIPPSDPYSGAGDSTTGGGDGTFDGTSDPVPVPNLPSVGAQDSGFITLFAPTVQQMKDLAHFMWVNPVFDLSAFKKLFADPMDCILGLSVVPVSVPTSGAQNVNIGNLVTSVTMNVASHQYIEVDCGTVTMQRFFGSYLDFEPYTKISIFLPYCGTHQLNADDISGKTIGVVYHIDILTGSCIAFVKCGDSVLYEFNGACGSNIPVNSLNFASTIENAIRIAVNIGTTVATAGASAPLTTATEGAQAIGKAANVGRAISLAGSTAEGALSMKPNVSRSGALGGGVGILGHQIPYMIVSRPRLCKPAKQDFFQGYPSFIQTTIGDLIGKGFTSFTNVIIAGQYLTDEEETELESILESGVYL